jgi:hypothetical protein
MTEDAVADGANIKAQIALRAPGLILGWESTVHPFSLHPEYQALDADLSRAAAPCRIEETRSARGAD